MRKQARYYDGKKIPEADFPAEVLRNQKRAVRPDHLTGCFCVDCLVGVDSVFFAAFHGRCAKCAYLHATGKQ